MLSQLIYDWNKTVEKDSYPQAIEIHDETLRDGLQSTSIRIPTVEERFEIILKMERLGIDSVNIGFPGAGPTIMAEVMTLARLMNEHKLKIKATCAGRTKQEDIEAILQVSQKSGTPIEAMLFLGTSPLRKLVEKWEIEDQLLWVKNSIRFASSTDMEVTFVTEDTTRSHPHDLERLFFAAIDSGATRLCICDTVGHAVPEGVYQLIRLVKSWIPTNVKIDFHGHMDRGLGLWNSIMALQAGASRIHATSLGIGERCGNTPIEELLTNLKLLNWKEQDLSTLLDYSHLVSKYFDYPIPKHAPVVGSGAFQTSTGVHTAAILKAKANAHESIVDGIYSGVPSSWLQKKQEIKIGPMSGKSSVKCWSQMRNVNIDEVTIHKILEVAKSTNKILEDTEIMALLQLG